MVSLATLAPLLVLLSSAPTPKAIDWKLQDQRAGVEVYTGLQQGSPYKAFKAVTTIDAPADEVLKVVEDVKGYPTWFAYTEETRLLELTPRGRLFYLQTRFPWPFANEDMVYLMTRSTHGDTTRFTLEGLPGHPPRVDGVYRMKRARGHIEVVALGDKTRVLYVMHSELGGRVPLWMANQNIHELPLRTLGALKARLEP